MSEPVTGPAAPAAVRPGEAAAVEAAADALWASDEPWTRRAARDSAGIAVAAAYGPIAEAVRAELKTELLSYGITLFDSNGYPVRAVPVSVFAEVFTTTRLARRTP